MVAIVVQIVEPLVCHVCSVATMSVYVYIHTHSISKVFYNHGTRCKESLHALFSSQSRIIAIRQLYYQQN
jgi:hypothetical protein